MKADKESELIRILSESSHGVSASSLAKALGTSDRSIRNYIKDINAEGMSSIASTTEGYVIQNFTSDNSKKSANSDERIYRVLSDLLINKEGFNAFDEADMLSVSTSTLINTIIPEIKKMITEYDLKIQSVKYQFILFGSEQNKRKLIGRIVTDNNYGFFTSKDVLEQLFPNTDIHGVMQELYDTCQNSKLFLNNFALNNLLIHILIILIRLESDDDLSTCDKEISSSKLLSEFNDKDEIIALADQISNNFLKDYNIHIPERDYQQILILIALSIDHGITNIENVMSQEFINNIISILSSVSKRYYTPDFDTEFALQFSLHMYQALQRSTFHISYPNPIGAQIKKDYAPVYDMAVFFAHRFSSIYHTDLNEDEIAFIAFHIGAYLENNNHNSERVSCIIIVENYHNFSKKLIEEINNHFNNDILILNVLPANRFLQQKPKCDLIISTIVIPLPTDQYILVNPILTKQNIKSIRNMIDDIVEKKKVDESRMFLRSLLHEELYIRNIKLPSKIDYINYMGQMCIDHHYVHQAFIQDVLLREKVSSTAFTDALAIPHAISQYADRSFICVIHNDEPIDWSGKKIHFILMIGITEQDMKYFKGAFDLIVELFYSTERTLKILQTNTFEEFRNNF
jgi:transcriptional antiterminator/mannitol/fructose-specific phosphotransferase system IIA component (Ntr-type)